MRRLGAFGIVLLQCGGDMAPGQRVRCGEFVQVFLVAAPRRRTLPQLDSPSGKSILASCGNGAGRVGRLRRWRVPVLPQRVCSR